jgi:hypothetical protein
MLHTLAMSIWGLVCIVCFVNIVLEIVLFIQRSKDDE